MKVEPVGVSVLLVRVHAPVCVNVCVFVLCAWVWVCVFCYLPCSLCSVCAVCGVRILVRVRASQVPRAVREEKNRHLYVLSASNTHPPFLFLFVLHDATTKGT